MTDEKSLRCKFHTGRRLERGTYRLSFCIDKVYEKSMPAWQNTAQLVSLQIDQSRGISPFVRDPEGQLVHLLCDMSQLRCIGISKRLCLSHCHAACLSFFAEDLVFGRPPDH